MSGVPVPKEVRPPLSYQIHLRPEGRDEAKHPLMVLGMVGMVGHTLKEGMFAEHIRIRTPKRS